ncbi:1-acyl-sn-glycerol-3-phosphate acyltransferase [Ponticoccus sp. SC2-23]|uniref:1-acyl-sn-glycerol-3-phosphate acyltransferase n=1 Tax=Alexandriicola marinus TaxID=2081710 RepID=UPI000FD80123|nr:1-acyl-sn-glycerol-3-phosphate acyltransferase [Alexandriicola marinus]MBM1220165.1 1-acyl-sn-glycerol-3-phosphate acyltransferase [Ponticoccus sp. SC6-9]MBM1224851.1 1-acyl-sn-glycerol-3-phosphate acyltransferase [Ponticoccus sp. SC6-15]MBM1228365.1 1-acyl-sn-glycerol-3-phosphate acyltransferase [Ponticoccus sp. SC6-38]MBM1233998.1 1-acyl-sn-glycerol-3-phosphate acyltransferase [Ponticoccus sp. SC6-45]MBM1238866.1 1-acyl-sn-glycerol-3-phosphate acyltransferase [Ponticoccus sp. SC6-49]MBM1
MFRSVTLPLWLLILILLFAAVTFASHFLFPSVRWFFRKRAERLVARLNERLDRPLEPFKLARRHDMIQRLIYDPSVAEAIVEYAREKGVPENVAFEKARDYAREIVPSFSATAYFTIGTRLARWLSKSLYRIRLGQFDRTSMDGVDRDAAVIFVMNHRSNMDYVLVTYLVSRSSALSYAVGEWARVWPLSSVIRAMGAYFIRRRNRSALYRRVLARYVQMAVRGGVTQAFFPEGGLSLDGRTAEPKLGLLSYIVEGWSPDGRDVIFVPVALNYDHVLEDKFLIAAGKSGRRRFRPPIGTVLRGLGGHFAKRLTGRFRGFGTASVGFGRPVSLSALMADGPVSLETLGTELMQEVKRVVPVLPVPLVCTILRAHPGLTDQEIEEKLAALLERLKETQANLPQREVGEIKDDALRILSDRGLIRRDGAAIFVADGADDIVDFYAASIAQHMPEPGPAADPQRLSAPAK